LRGSPSTIVIVLPPRPFFSIRSFAVTRGGTGWSAAPRVLHRQSFEGQPHVGQVRPLSVE
jgi:hypothetical protein